jgi:mono/diheme cytochrome c family protein
MKLNGLRVTFALVAALFVLAIGLAACAAKATPEAAEGVARPSKAGGPGTAITLTGDATKGATIFTANCVRCHGDQGKTGIENAGSSDGTVPNLNPIDESLVNKDPKTYATNLDLFIEHGSVPEGTSPALSMPSFGDDKTLQPQEIADVIAYVISLNPAK